MLLIDAGNSRLKWAFGSGDDLVEQGAVAWERQGVPEAAADAWQRRQVRRIVVSNVAGSAFAAALSDWSRRQWGVVPEFIAPCRRGWGVETRYREPSRLGVDRWLALIAVRAYAPVCVVDCGTAVTLDLLCATGEHLGGMILPGLSLMRDSLYQRAPGIFDADGAEEGAPSLLGLDTKSCIELGTVNAVAAAIERISGEWAQQQGPMKKIITGGDALAIQSVLKAGYHRQPDLVLRGLLVIANRSQ